MIRERGTGRVGWNTRRLTDAAVALFVVSIVGMMIIPLPTVVLDVLIAAQISIAVLLVLVAMQVKDALSFTSFPTLLLLTTLFRLALNVSSTRLILLQADAGSVIRAFGEFVVQGNYVVGAVVFAILTLIQFVVIAKGSERVAEVGARFTLDAMPGKQMAIDAELRGGSMNELEARQKRALLQRESQFYGAMDGAMKFVKGDAIAGIVITAINIVGGLAIGWAMRGMSVSESLRVYGLLTIGDGLVTQLPSLLVSTAAGLVVTRVASEDEASSLGSDIGAQIFGHPSALAIAAGFLFVLGWVPGLPTFPFMVLALTFGGLAFRLSRIETEKPRKIDDSDHARVAAHLEPVTLGLGSALFAKVAERRDSPLEQVISDAKTRLFEELGVACPNVRVRLNRAADEWGFTIAIREIPVAAGEIRDGGELELGQHLVRHLRRSAAQFIGLQEVRFMLDALERTHPALVQTVVPKPVSLVVLTEILRQLVAEGVSIRPLTEILDALALHGSTEKDPALLTEIVRAHLRQHITHAHARADGLAVWLVDPSLEDIVRDAVIDTPTGPKLALAPSTAREVIEAVRSALHRVEAPPILLTQPDVRRFLFRLLEVEMPEIIVLGHRDLDPRTTVKPVGHVSL
jgi:type III secretion protein V